MMEQIRQYVLSVIAAAILCGIVDAITPNKKAAPMRKLLTGIFMTFVAIRPLADIQLTALPSFADTYTSQAVAAVAEGEIITQQANAAIIKPRVEAYILDKAEALGVRLRVNVTLDEKGVPVSVQLSGAVSPGAKTSLETMLETELGIAKEDQQWSE